MLTAFVDFIGAAPALAVLLDVAVRAALLLACAFAITFALSRASAAVRHMVWAIAVSAVVLLPLLSLVAPAWRVLPRVTHQDARENAIVAQATTQTIDPIASAGAREQPPTTLHAAPLVNSAIAPETTQRFAVSGERVALVAWLVGATLMLLIIALGFLRVHVLARRARRITNGKLLAEIARVGRELEVGAVLALEGDAAAMPMTWGLLRPRLLLPNTAASWPQAKLKAVIRHELAHVRRKDAFWQLIAEVACALHWFNPLAWHAARRMRIEREHACDDEVLNAGSRPSEYASELLDVARSLRTARATSLAAIAMAQPRQLEGRLLAVLDESRARGAVRRKWPAWVAAIALVLPIAALRPQDTEAKATIPILGSHELRDDAVVKRTPARRTTGRTPARTQPRLSRAALITPPSAQGVAVTLQQADPCARGDKGNVSINSHSDDDTHKIKWETGSCKGTLHIRGKVRLHGDLSGIQSMAPGSDFRLWLNDGRDIRVVTAKPNGNIITYEYTVDGDKRSWSSEGRAWLATTLTSVARQTGFAADERVDYLLKQRGVSGVLAEVEAMSSDYVQRLYLQKLLARTTLNVGALESVIATATRTLDSDYEMAELLIAIANRYEFDDAVQRAFIKGTGTLSSDYEHRRAVSAALKKSNLTAENVAAILTSAQAIDSDYEKAELLLGIAERYKLDARMRAAYLASARGLKSDYEKGRVYKTLFKNGGLSAAEAAQVIDAVSNMSSDYERAEVLRLVPAAAFEDARMQQAYLHATADMKSDYEVRRALTPILAAGQLSAGAVDLVLNTALTIKSEYERAELLLALLKRHTLNAEQRKRAIKASDALRSEHERGRVSSALLRQMNSN